MVQMNSKKDIEDQIATTKKEIAEVRGDINAKKRWMFVLEEKIKLLQRAKSQF